MKVLSSNIRVCTASNDGQNSWDFRKEFCVEVLRNQKADLICFQEMMMPQFIFLKEMLNEYDSYGIYDDIDRANPGNTIFYKKSSLSHILSGGYWLSDRPHVPGSSSWGSACIRTANWVILQDKMSGKEFKIVNTHLDHVGQAARENQARLICEEANAFQDDYPQILTGDMNCDAKNIAIKEFLTNGWFDTYEAIHKTKMPGYTFHKFEGVNHKPELDKMDWIFVKGKVNVMGADIVKDSKDGRYPSDHYFVNAEVIF